MSTTHPTYPAHESADFATASAAPPAAPRAAPLVNKEDFARRWEFASFLEMFEASKSVGEAGGVKKWLLTALRGGKWLLWNDGEMETAQDFDSRDAALSNLPR